MKRPSTKTLGVLLIILLSLMMGMILLFVVRLSSVQKTSEEVADLTVATLANETLANETLVNETLPEFPSEAPSDETTEALTISSTSEAEDTVPRSIPFEAYRNQTSDFVGWLTIDGTNIDQPLVQGPNNDHYLGYDYLGNKSSAGALYIDYRNLGNFYDTHMSIYGHYMRNGTMFHDLHLFKDADFLAEHPYITVYGLREAYQYEIFSVQIVSGASYYLYFDMTDEVLVDYADYLWRGSIHKKQPQYPKDLRLLTLVTCTYEFDNARLLIHAYQKESIPMPKADLVD